MKKNMLLFFLLALVLNVHSQMLWQFNKDTITSWYYTDGDEFNDTLLNTGKWNYWYGWSRSIFSQKEQQYYTNGKNLELKNGKLNLFAKREPIEAKMVDWLPEKDSMIVDGRFYGFNKWFFNYTAGMIQSKKSYQYGYFEIKFKTPSEKGFWPAFWLYGGTPNEEIDWMELKTEKTNAIHVGRHSQKKEENKIRNIIRKQWWGGWVYFKGNLNKDYNIIAGEWNKDYVRYFLNGECIAYSRVPLAQEKVLCINLAVPSKNGPFHPAPDTSIIKSGNFEIDYVRIWTSDSQKATVFPKQDDKGTPTINDTIVKTKLKSKTKFLYGRKSDHKQEGFTLCLIPLENNCYNLQVLGKNIPANASFTMDDGTLHKNTSLKYGDNILFLEKSKGNVQLTVECYGKKLTHTIVR